MRYPWVAVCYFPTQVVLVDDDRHCLNPITRALRLHQIACEVFEKPKKALKYFLDHYKPLTVFDHCLKTLVSCEYDKQSITDHPINMDLPLLNQLLYQADRFTHISVAIIDYALNEMNGLELARELHHISNPLKKVMLTGQATKDIGLEGFTEGVLDMFIRKDLPDLTEYLCEMIPALQYRYFQELSQTIVKLLSLDNPCCLTDLGFIRFFENLRKIKGFIEHYLLNDKGDFVFLTSQGKPAFLGVYTDQTLVDQYDWAINQETVSDDVQQALKNKKGALFIYPESEGYPSDEKWDKILHPIQRIPQTPYYYALIEEYIYLILIFFLFGLRQKYF